MSESTHNWKPYQHIERAEVLIGQFDGNFDEDGTYVGKTAMFTVTPPILTLAQCHLELANMKMVGRQRA